MPCPLKPRRTVAPAEPLLSLAEVKAHVRVDHDDEDDLISSLIAAATDHLDGRAGVLGRALVTQTWVQEWSGFPACRRIRLPLPDVQSVTISYIDADGAEQTFPASDYHLTHDARSGLAILDDAASWPSADDQPDAVTVTMVAGFGDREAVPAAIRIAAMILVATWYASREAVVTGATASVTPISVDRLIQPYRLVGV
jgi:uncharacterized phiE125 gp8 family phage protein